MPNPRGRSLELEPREHDLASCAVALEQCVSLAQMADLQLLVHTARIGALSGAARVLDVTPAAAASAALKRLEAKPGGRLFERSTRAWRLTAHGQTFLDYAC